MACVFTLGKANNEIAIYANGSAAAATRAPFGSGPPSVFPDVPSNVMLGKRELAGNEVFYSGSTDEFHLSNVARSADWITTEYNNQSSPQTFYTIGSEELNPL